MISKENLYNLYILKNHSISHIIKEYRISRSKLEKLLNEYGIPKKTMSETLKSKSVQDKIKNTNLKKYNSQYFIGSKQFIEISRKSKKEKYGNENYNNIEKQKKTVNSKSIDEKKQIKLKTELTNLNKYGFTNPSLNNNVKNKIKKTKLEKYGNENYNNSNKQQKTILNKYGIASVSQLDEVKLKKKITSIKKYGTNFPWQNKEIKNKLTNIMIKKYGVSNALLLKKSINKAREKMKELYGVEFGFQSEEIQKKILKESFKVKEYKFPSGRITMYLGYENIALDILLNIKNINEKEITTNTDCPTIMWFDKNGIQRKHIPDIFIKNQNKIIEIKSEFTASECFMENILLKQKYALQNNYIYEIWVIDKNKKTYRILN